MVAVVACTQPCPVHGDASKAATLTVTQRLPDGTAEELTQALVLQVPPQGGHVAFVGAVIENFTECVELSAALKDLDGSLAAEEKRRVDLTGGRSDPKEPANFANVPVCPNFGTRDFPGQTWKLEVKVESRDGRAASLSRSLDVVPTCAFGGSDCACECAADYTFGKCGRDGG
jgi:hypothetical protein